MEVGRLRLVRCFCGCSFFCGGLAPESYEAVAWSLVSSHVLVLQRL